MRIPRKLEHVHHALALGSAGDSGMEDVKLVPNAIPDTHLEQISLETAIGGLNLSSPIVVNAMTGGARETEEINRDLAIAARETGLAMAVGSQMAALKNAEVTSSYTIVRRMNPHGLVFGNLGSEATLEQAQRAVEMLRADALQIHLNALQELIMPEGDRDFRGALERIQQIAEDLPVPVIVKEVGFGLTRETVRKLLRAGVRHLDVGGAGGTNFAAIENARRQTPLNWLNDWGVSTAIALLEALEERKSFESRLPFGHPGSIGIVASGGMRTALDICKALALGASAVGMAGSLLKPLREEGVDALIAHIERLHADTRLIMTALGAGSIVQLATVPLVITGDTARWCELRGIALKEYAGRRLSD